MRPINGRQIGNVGLPPGRIARICEGAATLSDILVMAIIKIIVGSVILLASFLFFLVAMSLLFAFGLLGTLFGFMVVSPLLWIFVITPAKKMINDGRKQLQ
jgi:ABC-type transport system involved in cytochrome bd biosynthesis fused ATPase/permease subunit